jgi:2-methylisocitrate lyase-like PEP mutase family enzyme
MSKYADFAALHTPGDPLILFNIWDAGSAKVAADAGAKAIATGSHSVAEAFGFADGEAMPLDLALANAARIVAAVDLPVTVDFEGGYANHPDGVGQNVARLVQTGAIGCNFEDQIVGGSGLHPIAYQADRIRAVREAAGPDFFINARTDIFLKKMGEPHDEAMVDAAIDRAAAYFAAGASGFFVPGMADIAQIRRVCAEVALPVNFMAYPGAPDAKALAGAGIARISHGPFPHNIAMAAFAEAAKEALSGS